MSDANAELVRRMTAAMRAADRDFEKVGGSTRHHVRDCLLPILREHGLALLTSEQVALCVEALQHYGDRQASCERAPSFRVLAKELGDE